MLGQQTSLTGLRSPLGAIITSVVIAHGAFLAWMNTPPAETPPGGTPARVVHLSLIKARPIPTALKEEAPAAPPIEAEPHTPTDAPVQEDPTLPPASVSADNLDATESKAPSDEYLPRSLLSRAPRPSTTVIVPFPEQVKTPGRYTTILALFIDENGVVRRVRVEGPALPQPLEDAATKTFLEAPFQPGEREGHAVKSLIRVEVVFDNTPLKPDTAPRSL